MSWQDLWTVAWAVPGCFFITVGTLGLLRLEDLHSRIHALTKADTAGLGCVVMSLLPHAGSAAVGAKLVLVWGLALASASVIAHLMARDVPPQIHWERAPDRGSTPEAGS